MKNNEIDAAWVYHNGSKHSYQSIRANRHYLDFENQPLAFKIYSDLEPIALPAQLLSSGMPSLAAIAAADTPRDRPVTPTRQTLAEMLFLSAGITRRRKYPGGEILFRAAACTGALYHIDLYLACADLADLPAGVYHFSPHDFALRRLRQGDFRGVLTRASGAEPSVVEAPAVLLCASTFWRNAWKYQARAYRHCYWDNGTILANLLAAAVARGLPAKVVIGFVDAAISELLGLNPKGEAPLSLVALGCGAAQPGLGSTSLPPLVLRTEPLSKTEIDYPAMRAMHEASSLASAEEVVKWRAGRDSHSGAQDDRSTNGGRRVFLQAPSADDVPPATIEDVIVRRGSTRQFARESITFGQLSTMLDRATRGIPADFLSAGDSLNQIYLIVHAVDDLAPGAYVYRRDLHALELLKEGDFRGEAGELGLGQDIPADCSVNVYFLADLNRALERLGNRGYRAAQLEASIMGGKLYLAAYAQGLGASGLTFFDDDVTEYFSPQAAAKSVMFLIALGKSLKRKSSR
jgi:SagB-type dehydrogenase family enzyme